MIYDNRLRAWLRRTTLARRVKASSTLNAVIGGLWRGGWTLAQWIVSIPSLVGSIFSPLLLAMLILPDRGRKVVGARSGGQIVMLVISEVFRDPRVEREARALAAAGFPVKILYPDYFSAYHKVRAIDWGPGIEFVPLPDTYGGYMHRFPYVFGSRFLRRAVRERPFAYHAHDLNTSIIALAAARHRGAHCVCDFHEWYSENVTWNKRVKEYRAHPRWLARFYAFAERLVLQRASAVITVCDSIAEELRKLVERPAPVVVIRNIPRLSSVARDRQSGVQDLRRQLSLPKHVFLVLYQGGTGPTRLLEPIIEALTNAPDAALIIRGPGIEYYGPGYAKLAAALGVESRLRCLPAVNSSEVVLAAASADAGIWTLPNLCKNFSYALPNKLFEYLAAGLPVLAADYPEVRKLVQKYRVGLLFEPYSPGTIAEAINRLAGSPALRAEYARNALEAMRDMRASDEWEKLVALYRSLRAGASASELPPGNVPERVM